MFKESPQDMYEKSHSFLYQTFIIDKTKFNSFTPGFYLVQQDTQAKMRNAISICIVEESLLANLLGILSSTTGGWRT